MDKSLSSEAKSLKPGIYEHFKGDRVEVAGIALHSETLEELVLYKHISGKHTGEPYFWVRPIAMFLEQVEHNSKSVPRFRYIGEVNNE